MLNRRFVVAVAAFLIGGPAIAQDKSIVVASTTSTQDSGIFGHILPLFEAKTGIQVKVIAQGTGQARRLAGDVVFLARGRVVEHTPADRFFTGSMTPEATAFLRGDLVI